MTANIPMSNFKFTGLAAGSALTDSATLQQVQYGFGSFLTAVSGTNTIVGTATPTPAYTVGQRYTFVPAVTNTGATTLNISSVGAGAVQWAGAALTGGELVAGTAYTVYVTAVTPVFEIVGATQFPDTRALVVGGTDPTKKLRFEVDGITTGTTRVFSPPNTDLTLTASSTVARTITIPARDLTVGGVLGTAVASTSGTAIDFTGIPAGTRRITVMFVGVSLSGTNDFLFQLGPSGGPENTGYLGSCMFFSNVGAVVGVNYTSGFGAGAVSAGGITHGSITFSLENSAAFTWVASGVFGRSEGAFGLFVAGSKSLAAELTQVRITTNGSDTFDAGAISISYE